MTCPGEQKKDKKDQNNAMNMSLGDSIETDEFRKPSPEPRALCRHSASESTGL